MYPRYAARHLEEARADTPVILLSGARQSGKSTLARLAAQTPAGEPIVFPSGPPPDGQSLLRYFSLDDAQTFARMRSEPQDFLQNHQSDDLTVIDEVQRIPELLIAIKYEVDRRRLPGRFLLTGSANILTLPKIPESLAGRIEIIRMLPLAQCELEGTAPSFLSWAFSNESANWLQTESKANIIERAFKGGFPDALSRSIQARRDAWFGSYLDTVIQREIKSISAIEDDAGVVLILKALASRSGGPRNIGSLSHDTHIPATTISRYLALLKMTFLVSEIPAWSGGVDARIIHSPKMLIIDSGLYANLLELSPDHPHMGFLIETFVGTELQKLISFETIHKYTLMHFRTRRHEEVDFILEGANRQVVGIEVKLSSTVQGEDFKGLTALRNLAKARFHRGIVMYCGDRAMSFGKDMWALPISSLWRGDE